MKGPGDIYEDIRYQRELDYLEERDMSDLIAESYAEFVAREDEAYEWAVLESEAERERKAKAERRRGSEKASVTIVRLDLEYDSDIMSVLFTTRDGRERTYRKPSDASMKRLNRALSYWPEHWEPHHIYIDNESQYAAYKRRES